MSSTPKAKLAHVALFTRDLDKMVDFYTKARLANHSANPPNLIDQVSPGRCKARHRR